MTFGVLLWPHLSFQPVYISVLRSSLFIRFCLTRSCQLNWAACRSILHKAFTLFVQSKEHACCIESPSVNSVQNIYVHIFRFKRKEDSTVISFERNKSLEVKIRRNSEERSTKFEFYLKTHKVFSLLKRLHRFREKKVCTFHRKKTTSFKLKKFIIPFRLNAKWIS